MKVYLIGSLRNPVIPALGSQIRSLGFDVFDDWFGAGERADAPWQEYEEVRGRTYAQALKGYAVENVAGFDKRHLDDSDIAILVMPAGKSGHLELGYMLGRGKKAYVLFFEEPDRWDAMYWITSGVFFDKLELFDRLTAFKQQEEKRESLHSR